LAIIGYKIKGSSTASREVSLATVDEIILMPIPQTLKHSLLSKGGTVLISSKGTIFFDVFSNTLLAYISYDNLLSLPIKLQ